MQRNTHEVADLKGYVDTCRKDAEPSLKNDSLLSEEICQLRSCIDRVKPLLNQYKSGDLQAMNKEQRRQIEMYTLWLEDLEELNRGRMPQGESWKTPNTMRDGQEEGHKSHASGVSATGTSSRTTAAAAVETGQEGGRDAVLQRGQNGSAAVNHENDELQESSQRRESASVDKTRKLTVLDRCVGDPNADKELVVEHLRSLLPSAREFFLKKYIEKVTDTEDLQSVKKRFDKANNVRQKILLGLIKSPSRAQKEMISELSELRRMLSLLGQHKLKEQKRLVRFFLPYLEEIGETKGDEKKEKGDAYLVPVTDSKEGKNDGGSISVVTTPHFAALNATMIDRGVDSQSQASSQVPVETLSSEHVDFVETVGDSDFLTSYDVVNKSIRHQDAFISRSFFQEKGVGRSCFSPDPSTLSGVTMSTCEVTFQEISQKTDFPSADSSVRDLASECIVDLPNLRVKKDNMSFEMNTLPIKEKHHPQDQQHNMVNKGKDESTDLTMKNVELVNSHKDKKRHRRVKRKVGELGTQTVNDPLEYVRLHIPLSNKRVHSEKVEQAKKSKEIDTWSATVLRRVEKELKYVLRHPVSRVTVIGYEMGGNDVDSSDKLLDARVDDVTVARWDLHISPSDGPLAGQVVHVVVVFSRRYPFVPPLVYSTVCFPLATLMVSEVGQLNTLQLPWTCSSTTVGVGDGAADASSTQWHPRYSIHKLFFHLQDFFGAKAFLSSCEVLGRELYWSSILEARLKCGKLAADFMMGETEMSVLTSATLKVVNGPFIVFSNSRDTFPKRKNENIKKKGANGRTNEEISDKQTIHYYTDGVRNAINGPFEGCWGHLLQMDMSVSRKMKGKKKLADTIQREVVGPVAKVCFFVPVGDVLPVVELVAISQETVLRKKPHWAESILNNLHRQDIRGENNPYTLNLSTVVARFQVDLTATKAGGGSVVQFFMMAGDDEEDTKKKKKDEDKGDDNLPLPRCVEGGNPGETYVYLPSTDAFIASKGRVTSLSWAVVLRVEDGASATVVFSIPTTQCSMEDVVCAAEAETCVSIDVVDVVADMVSDVSESSACVGAKSYSNLTPLFCVASLDVEGAAGLLGVMCEVVYSPQSKHEFMPEDVIVVTDLILSESAFDLYFASTYNKKKFFIAPTFLAPCTFFLPLAEPHKMLLTPTKKRLKLSITQVHRNPDASTAYVPPFKCGEALRFFALVIRSLVKQGVTGDKARKDDAKAFLLTTMFIRILFTFTLLVKSEVGLQEICRIISLSDPLDCPIDTQLTILYKNDVEELVLLKWLLASWCKFSILDVSVEEITDGTTTSVTASQTRRESWHSATEKLVAYLIERNKRYLVPYSQDCLKVFEVSL